MGRVNLPEDVFKFYNMRGPDECWEYTGSAWGGQKRELRPYYMANGRRQIAYRWVYELVHGVQLTTDQVIRHTCDNGGQPIGCGNPAHLLIGTNQDNSNDMKQRERHGLPHSVIRAIRRLLDQGQTQDEIARLYGLTRETVSAIATQRVYSHVKDEE